MIRLRSVTPRQVLNELKWRGGKDISTVEIWYVHRGAPGDAAVIRGREIRELGRSFFKTDDASVPYHRIFRIEQDGKILFDRKRLKNAGK